MPAKDIFHDCVKVALVKDGWQISHDPYSLKVGKKDLFIDLGAGKLIAAEQEVGQILLENKVLKLLTFNPETEVITKWIS
jgi:XisH protein